MTPGTVCVAMIKTPSTVCVAMTTGTVCGGGSTFLICADWGRMFNNSFPTCTLFLLLLLVGD